MPFSELRKDIAMSTTAEVKIPTRRAVGPVRITLPAKVAYDPGLLKESLAGIAELLGCPKCVSGADCLLMAERNLVLDPQLRASSVPDVSGPTPHPWRDQHLTTVGLSSGVKYDIKKVVQAMDKVIDLIGSHPCISGFDVLLKDQLRTIVVNDKLQAQQF